MKRYQDRKKRARQRVIEMYFDFWDGETSHYQSEVADFENKCYTVGKRYGLLKEFRENAIL